MFLRNVTEQQSTSSEKDHDYNEKMPSTSSNLEQNLAFPYIGPPGSGPGLLGSRPGAGKLEYLIALEHYATSLKSALTVAAALKNGKNKELDVEMVYDSICDIESELQSLNGTRFSEI